MQSRRAISVLAALLGGGALGRPSRPGGDVSPCREAELFATDNSDPLFEIQADVTIAQNGAAVTGATLLDGVFWSNEL